MVERCKVCERLGLDENKNCPEINKPKEKIVRGCIKKFGNNLICGECINGVIQLCGYCQALADVEKVIDNLTILNYNLIINNKEVNSPDVIKLEELKAKIQELSKGGGK